MNKLLNDDILSVYPNPSFGHLNIELAEYSGQKVHLMMYDLRGKQVLNRQITSAFTTLDLVNLQPGTYVVRLESGEETFTRKIVMH